MLVLAGVVLLAGTRTLLLADSIAATGRDLNLGVAFARGLITWGLWGLCFEPLLMLSALLSRLLHGVALVLLVHAGLSVVLAFGLHAADRWLGAQILSDRPLMQDARPFPRRTPDASAHPPEWNPGPAPLRDRLERRRAIETARARFGRNRWAESGIIVYWLIVGLGLAVRSYMSHHDQERRSVELELRAARLESELTTARLAQLESQLQPHFLFNALHSVGGLVRSGRSDAAQKALSSLASLLRASFQHATTEEVRLGDELDLVEAYLEIERIRLGERLGVEFQVDPSSLGARLPPLILLPLVENTIKHAIAPRPEGGRLELRVHRDGEWLRIELLDDGPGFPLQVLEALPGENPSGGIGLANTRSRLQALFGKDALRLENDPSGGARIILCIPYHD